MDIMTYTILSILIALGVAFIAMTAFVLYVFSKDFLKKSEEEELHTLEWFETKDTRIVELSTDEKEYFITMDDVVICREPFTENNYDRVKTIMNSIRTEEECTWKLIRGIQMIESSCGTIYGTHTTMSYTVCPRCKRPIKRAID